MGPEKALLFLQALGIQNGEVKSNGWITASCPLARWTHKKHSDKTPSFGLRAVEGEASNYNCFACSSGSAETLLQTLEMYAQVDGVLAQFAVKQARECLNDEEVLIPLPEFQEHPQAGKVFVEWPMYWLQSFIPLANVPLAVSYLLDRKVSYETMKSHRLCFDTKKNMIVCPYWDVYGRFAGARGRTIDPDEDYKHHDYTFQEVNNSSLVWYNEPALELSGPVVMVEGQFDTWRVERRWPKVVGNLTAKPTPVKLKKLASASMWIHIPDSDEAGELSKKLYISASIEYKVPLRIIDLPKSDGEKLDPDKCHEDFLYDRIMEVL